MQGNYSTILFDFDGTLTSSLELWLQAFHYAFAKFGIKLTDETIIRRCFYRVFADLVSEFGLPCPIQFGEKVKEGLAIFFENAKLFSGVQETLNSCMKRNIRLAVVSSSPRTIVEKTLKSLKIESFFQVIVTADDIINFKPHPEPVLLALKRLQSKSTESLFIGDSQADMLAGRAAGVKTGLFYPEPHNQFYNFQQLKATDPHFIFHHYDQLHQYLFGVLIAQ